MTSSRHSFILKTIPNARINNQITAPELRVIDDEGVNLGLMTRDAALALAKSKGLDLIEISAKAVPPVARIMSFDKYRYAEEKKFKKQRAAQKSGDLKQVQIGIGTAAHDLELKAKIMNEFLGEGHTVEILMVLRGRQKGNKDFAMEKTREFLKRVEGEYKTLMSPRFIGKGIAVQISK